MHLVLINKQKTTNKMKVSNEVLSPEMTSQSIEIEAINASTQETQTTTKSPDYTEMMIEIQKIGEPVSFESLKDFYNISGG